MWTVWIDQLTKRQINTTTEFLQIPNPANSSFTIFTLLIILNKANPIENESFSGGAPGRAKPGQPIYSAPLSAHRHTRTMQLDSIFSAGSALLFYINSVHCCPFKIEGVKTNPQNSLLLFRVHFTPTLHFTAVQILVLWHGLFAGQVSTVKILICYWYPLNRLVLFINMTAFPDCQVALSM